MRVLLIGERFNQDRNPAVEYRLTAVTDGRPGAADFYWRLMRRLRALRDVKSRAKLQSIGIPDRVESCNLLPPAPQGYRWWVKEAEDVARDWWDRVRCAYDLAILAGGSVRRAFHLGLECSLLDEDLYGLPLYMGERFGDFTPNPHNEGGYVGHAQAVVIPHPSGLCRWWNDSTNVYLLRLDMRSLLKP